MLTYELKKAPGVPLYEALYRCIRSDILSGGLAPGQKLPSKRALAAHLEVSKITVEAAYNQLAAEGYIAPKEKVGYFVEQIAHSTDIPWSPLLSGSCRQQEVAVTGEVQEQTPPDPGFAGATPLVNAGGKKLLDLHSNAPAKFPFSVWSRLQRQVLLDLGPDLLKPVPHQGLLPLRQAIARHLSGFRGMAVSPDNIIIGAGTDFLYNLALQLLGRELSYALEEPGYGKIRSIYEAAGAATLDAAMDESGVIPEALGNARVLHVSPSHHFPLGLITPNSRRQALLRWAEAADGYIIEDDYDSEFRFNAHPQAAMYSPGGRVIYMNSFTKSLAPSIRMGYMVLPDRLMEAFRERLSFYGCTVGSFEQHTLALFLSQGHFEKHINRMRKFYKGQRNRLLDILKASPYAEKLTIQEADAGLHFLLKVDTDLTDEALEAFCSGLGLKVYTLGRYYHGPVPAGSEHTLVVNYSGLTEADLEKLEL